MSATQSFTLFNSKKLTNRIVTLKFSSFLPVQELLESTFTKGKAL